MAQALGLQAPRWTADLSQIGLSCVLQILNPSPLPKWTDEERE